MYIQSGAKNWDFFCHQFFDKSPNFWVHFFLSSYLTRISRMRVSVDSTTVKTFLNLYKTDGDTLKWTPYIVNSSSRKWPSKILDKRPYIVDSRHLTRLKSFAGSTGDFPLSCKSLLLVIKQRSHAKEKHFLELEVTKVAQKSAWKNELEKCSIFDLATSSQWCRLQILPSQPTQKNEQSKLTQFFGNKWSV